MTSIIIPVWNQWELTAKCLESVVRFTPEDHEIIIVDNGSDRALDSLEAIHWAFQQIRDSTPNKYIRNDTNLGYPAAINQGLAIAKGDTICLLNNDTQVTEGWLTSMLAVLNRTDMRVGIVGPISDNVSGLQGQAVLAAFIEDALFVGRLVGFCMLIRREVVDAIGGLDPRFGLGNFDDDDYCIRATLAGWQLAIAPRAFVHHVGGATFRAENIDYRALLERNWVLMKEKWGIPMELPMGAEMQLMVDTTDLAQYNVPLEFHAAVS